MGVGAIGSSLACAREVDLEVTPVLRLPEPYQRDAEVPYLFP